MTDKMYGDLQLLLWIGVGMALLGLAVLAMAWMTRRTATASRTWPTAAGTILTSHLEERKGKGGPNVHPKISYAYRAGAGEHTGQRVQWGVGRHTAAEAAAIVEKYPVGRQVTVYYHPHNPQQAVLDPHGTVGSAAMLFVAGLCLLPGVAMAVFALFKLAGG